MQYSKRKPKARINIKTLGEAIKKDNELSKSPAEKPLKLTNPKGFEDTLGIIERHESSPQK